MTSLTTFHSFLFLFFSCVLVTSFVPLDSDTERCVWFPFVLVWGKGENWERRAFAQFVSNVRRRQRVNYWTGRWALVGGVELGAFWPVKCCVVLRCGQAVDFPRLSTGLGRGRAGICFRLRRMADERIWQMASRTGAGGMTSRMEWMANWQAGRGSREEFPELCEALFV